MAVKPKWQWCPTCGGRFRGDCMFCVKCTEREFMREDEDVKELEDLPAIPAKKEKKESDDECNQQVDEKAIEDSIKRINDQ